MSDPVVWFTTHPPCDAEDYMTRRLCELAGGHSGDHWSGVFRFHNVATRCRSHHEFGPQCSLPRNHAGRHQVVGTSVTW